ncbi:uncharacterized protein RBU33_012235 [Hipposideros larvatus]
MSSGERAVLNLEELRRQRLPRRGLNPEGEGRKQGVRGAGEHPRAYHEHGDPGSQRVEEHGGHGAAVLRARVGLAVGAVVAEEALHVHAPRAAGACTPPRSAEAAAGGAAAGAAGGGMEAAGGRGGGRSGFEHRQAAAAETATPGRAPDPLPAPCPPQAPPARARGRAGGRGVPGAGQRPQRPGEGASAVQPRGVKPPGPPGGGGVGGPGGRSRDSDTWRPSERGRSGAGEAPRGVKTKKGWGGGERRQ